MNKKQLTAALEQLDMRPGRGLGQNFLLDGNLLDCIVRLGAPAPGGQVLEIGPGFGALTEKLLAAGAKLCSIEFDHRLADYLREHVRSENFTLIEADACTVDYSAIFPAGTSYRAIANLPYAVSTVCIAHLLDSPAPPEAMLFMLQREMGERLAAAPGNKSYGALSVRCQLQYHVSIERIVPPEVFYPPPKVESALVGFRRRTDFDGNASQLKFFNNVVKLLFSQRRKQMGKVLGGTYGRDNALKALAETGLSPELRPDRVTVGQFRLLAMALQKLNSRQEEKK